MKQAHSPHPQDIPLSNVRRSPFDHDLQPSISPVLHPYRERKARGQKSNACDTQPFKKIKMDVNTPTGFISVARVDATSCTFPRDVNDHGRRSCSSIVLLVESC